MRITLSIVILLAGMCIGAFLSNLGHRARPELALALPLKDTRPCVSPTADEQRVYDVAVEILEMEQSLHPLWIGIGAQRFLAAGLYRKHDDKTYTPVCAPPETYSRAAKAITQSDGFNAYLERYQLELAGRFPDPPPYVVEAVGEVAFEAAPHPERDELSRRRDLRPVARTVLAGFGRKSSGYLEIAREQVSSRDSLGTGAAQITAAAGQDSDLIKIGELIHEVLSSVPEDRALSIDERNRVYELAYAFTYTDLPAKRYSGSVREIMKRKVMSNATIFGLVELHPKQMCLVLEAIGESAAVDEYEYCRDPKYPYTQ